MTSAAERAEALEALIAYASASASQLRQLLPGMAPNVARRVARIATQLETCTDALTERTPPDPMTNTTTRDVDVARAVRCPTCSAGAGCYCTSARGRQLQSVHIARVEAARSDSGRGVGL